MSDFNFDDLMKLSIDDVIKLKAIVDERIENSSRKYYMHSLYCNTDEHNRIIDYGINHSERYIELKIDEFIDGNYAIPYHDDDYMYGYHVSFFSDKERATDQEILKLEELLYKVLNTDLPKNIEERIDELNQEIIDRRDDIVVQEILKTTQKKEIDQMCKNYLRSKKFKSLK